MFWGFVEEAFNKLFSTRLCVRSRLSVEDWTRLLQEVERIKAHIIHILTIKLQNWEEFPWLLCWLTHPLVAEARRCASGIINKFRRAPLSSHLRTSIQVCTGDVGRELESFAFKLVSFARLPLLRYWKNRLKFILLNDNAVEGPHGWIC